MTNNGSIKKNRTAARCEVALSMVFLTCGCAIYLLFRSKSLNIYQWCKILGLSDTVDSLRYIVRDWQLSDFTRYSLPDGLYCAAYILMIDAIWHNNNSLVKYIIISLVPLATISSEVLQYYGLVKGTFDTYDLICYSVPPIFYFIYINNSICLTIKKL